MRLKSTIFFVLTMVFFVTISQAQQEPKKSTKKKTTTSANPKNKKENAGATDRIDVSDQSKPAEVPASKKSSNKDKAVLPKK